jgi:RNA polymerase sigma factor (sigma-70 family)
MAGQNIQKLAQSFIQSGSDTDFVNLYYRIKPGLLNHCKSILADEESAQDAVANTMAKIWTKIHQYDSERGNFSTWVYNIARNESLVIKKGEDRYMPLVIETTHSQSENGISTSQKNRNVIKENLLFEPDFITSSETEMEILYGSVIEKMRDLPDIYKDILYDREILRMKYQEIADKHGMKKRAIATRIRRARLKIREMFPNAKIVFDS